GGVDYIAKPIQKEELLARVGTHLENYLYKNRLEQAVKRRTEELEHANTRLSEEIDRRKQSEENLRITLQSIGEAVIATDIDRKITLMNPVAEALTGWSQAETTGRALTEVFRIVNEKTGEAVENPVDTVFRSGKIVGQTNHTVLLAKDGRKIPIDDFAAPIVDEKGAMSGLVLTFRDVTER
ncbi:MAG: PAS domain-containing protein, partial [Deltaproteobacteria bacterium]|nr:PAS domain-containing protein [Deltaproteobacteria bacterium]